MTPKRYTYNAVVRSIYDGDTMRVDVDLGFNTWIFNMSIRLYGIDTPEIRGEERELGLKAKKFVTDRIAIGDTITLITEKDSTGKYGRYLGTILYGEELTNLNEELVASGNADVY